MDERRSIRVPDDVAIPADAGMTEREHIRQVNGFLAEMRKALPKMRAETERLSNIRSTGFVHNGPNGIILGD